MVKEIPPAEPYNMLCDIWSLGVSAYVLSFGQLPTYTESCEKAPMTEKVFVL